MMRVRVVMALGLLVACVGVTWAEEEGGIGLPPLPTPKARFVSYKAGPQVGSVQVEGSWSNFTGVDKVTYTVTPYSPNGQMQQTQKVSLTSPPIILATTSWTGTVSGLTSGHIVKDALVEVFSGNQMMASDTPALKPSVTVP
jgi:ABC-type transporter Mla maintaining outer membrane lipid asymmetry permease subunit MlaE